MAKKSALFGDFNTAEGSYNLFENAMRKAIDFDAYASDIFEAKVLTVPTLITNALLGASVPAAPAAPSNFTIPGTNYTFTAGSPPPPAIASPVRTYACMVRIRGQLSTHKFLRDPCSIEDTKTAEERRKVFNLIQQHTKVFIYNDGEPLPQIGQIIEVRLERGSFGSFKTDSAQFIGVKAGMEESNVDRQKECESAIKNFESSDFVALQSFNFGERTWNGTIPPQEEIDRIYDVWLATNGLDGIDPEDFNKCGIPGSGFEFQPCFSGTGDFLHPDFKVIVDKALEFLSKRKLTLEIKSAKRDLKEQIDLRLRNQIVPSSNKTLLDDDILYGSSDKFNPPTAQLPGEKYGYGGGSRHLYGLAVDFGPPLNDTSEGGKAKARNSEHFKALLEFSKTEEGKFFQNFDQEPWHWSFDGG